MVKYFKKIGTFSKNIIIVFMGTMLVNIFNLIYQLLIAHKLKPEDFAAFNALLSIFVLIASPLGNLQTVMAKYVAEFFIHQDLKKIQALMAGILKRVILLAALTFIIFYFISFPVMEKLKIASGVSGLILALLLAFSWIAPVFLGALQGMESFYWLSVVSVASGLLKLLLAILFISMGFGMAGALGALMISVLVAIIFSIIPIKNILILRSDETNINFRAIFIYVFPVAVSSFCFMALVNTDMILVKYFFTADKSGIYSLAQMVGKIFLFLPAAISVVMFPKTSGLNARNMDTTKTLKRSLVYGSLLCLVAVLVYNLFPVFILKVLTGKAFPEAVFLGRFFGISMSFFTLFSILMFYFLSINDLRFIKYLAICLVCQLIAIVLFHSNLFEIQVILCISSIVLFFVHLKLAIYQKIV